MLWRRNTLAGSIAFLLLWGAGSSDDIALIDCCSFNHHSSAATTQSVMSIEGSERHFVPRFWRQFECFGYLAGNSGADVIRFSLFRYSNFLRRGAPGQQLLDTGIENSTNFIEDSSTLLSPPDGLS